MNMRIDAYTQLQPIQKTQKANRSVQTGSVSTAKDQLQISSIGKDLQTAKAALANTPDIREDLTSSIKTSIQNGTYQVDNSSFADKLLEKFKAAV